jgi:myo-inositol 2-dehydrogenase/D-chiro-inositol 1-dehydrogenase
MKVGLLGAGRIGQVHAKSIISNPRSELVAVSDVFVDAAIRLAATYGCESLTTEEILNDPAIDAVLIATSTDTHADLIEKAVAAGKAVLCEKPVDLDLERARTCLKAIEDSDRPVMVGFNRRFDPNFATLKKQFDEGGIGKGELLTVTSFDPTPPPVAYVKVSGGLYRDMAIHDFDMVCWIFGEAPVSVTAIGSSIVDDDIGAAGDVDTAVVVLKFEDGRIAVIKNSRRAVYGYDQRIELLGSEGLLSANNVLENTVEHISVNGAISAKPEYFFLERYMRAYEAEWAAFVEAVEDEKPVPVSLADGVFALTVAEAATKSSQSGLTVNMNSI